MYPEGRLFLWGEIKHRDSAEFFLHAIGLIMIETILFIFRVLVFKQWSGEVEMCIDIQNVGRRYLIVLRMIRPRNRQVIVKLKELLLLNLHWKLVSFC